MQNGIDDDEYVANLLKEDAKSSKKKYDLVGIDAFNPKRLRNGAPKPNTNFLRHIIRQTDSHNAALLAKEAEESNARLKQMNKEQRREQERVELKEKRQSQGRLTPVLSDVESSRRGSKRRTEEIGDEDEHRSRRRRKERSHDSRDSRSKNHSNRHEREREERRRDAGSDEERSSRRSEHTSRRRHGSNRHDECSSEEEHYARRKEKRYDQHRSSRRSKSRSRSRSPKRSRHHKSSRHRHRSQSKSHSPTRRKSRSRDRHTSKRSSRRRSPQSDSDPLEAIVGPLPPPKEPTVRSRGRGAHKPHDTGIDSRFSASYDPSIHVHHEHDVEDNWGDAVEAFRDRQKFKQQGAERLKAAGFTDAQVTKWEKGDQKDEDDVVWSRRGQAREWDRGKVVGEDGDVQLKAEWGRLT